MHDRSRAAEGAVVGVFGDGEPLQRLRLGLSALRHRGADEDGVVLVTEAGLSREPLGDRPATAGIASSRRPKLGAGPVIATLGGEALALAWDGGLVNAEQIWAERSAHGGLWRGGGDEELVLQLMAASARNTLVNRWVDALGELQGGFAALLLTRERLLAARDPLGLRPLFVGRLGGGWAVASEQPALERLGARACRELDPGELLIVDRSGVVRLSPWPRRTARPCAVELGRRARPDGSLGGQTLAAVRRGIIERLAQDAPAVDAVSALFDEDWGAAAILGAVMGAPVTPVGVTLPGGEWVASPMACAGRRILLVVDPERPSESIPARLRALRRAGATALHLRLTWPVTVAPCSFGGRAPDARRAAPEDLGDPARLDVESLGGVSAETLSAALPDPCLACFGEAPPVTAASAPAAGQLPLFQSVSAEEV
jgi:amidophosphoribosyltransferase